MVVESLEVQLQSKADHAVASLNNLVKHLGIVAEGISAIGKNTGLQEFAKKAQEAAKEFASIQNVAKSISGGIEPQMHKVSKSVSEIAGEFREKFKDIPVKVDFSRPESEMKKFQSQAENAQNALTRIMESSTADKQIKGIEKWSIALAQANNAIEQLQSRLSETTKLNIEFPKPKLSEYEDDITRHLQSAGAFGLLKEYLDEIKNSTQQATESAREFTDAFNPDAMASVFGESARDIENWGQVIERVGEKAVAVLHESPRPFDIATDGIEEAQQNIDSISSQLRNMGDLMKRAFTFSAVRDIENWRQLADGIKNYVQNAKVAAGIKIYTDDYKNVLSDIERTKEALEKLEQKKRDMEAAGTGEESREWQKIISDISAAESRLDSYMAKRHEMEASGGDTEFSGGPANQSWIKGMVVTAGEAMSSLRQKIGEIGGAVSQAIGNIPIIGRVAKESAFLGKAAFDGLRLALSGIVSVSGKTVSALSTIASGISRLVSGIKSAISKLSSMAKSLIGVKSASKGMNTSLSGGLKTILKYGLGIRSLYTLINKMRTAAKEGFGNLAQYSSETNESLSMLKSSLGALKNSLAVAFAPIVNVIAPYLSTFIDMLTRAFNAVGRFFAALTGKSFAVQAVKNFSDYTAGVSKAGKAAKKAGKEAQAAIRPFDELKVISINKKDDSGSGEISPADMFTTVPVESEISDLAQKIRDAWEKADFTEIGAILGAKLKNGLDSIDWEPIKKTAAKVGKSIGTLINGFVEVKGLADSIGRTAGEAINTGITGINAFLDNTHWDSIGKFIGDGLNGLVNSIAWEDIGHLFAAKINAIFETLSKAVKTFDWKNLGKSLSEGLVKFINDLNTSYIGESISNTIKGLLDLAIEFLENTDWKEFGDTITKKISDFIDSIDWTGIAERIAEGIGAALGAAFAFIWGLIKDAWSNIVDWWYDVAFEDGKFTIKGLFNGIAEAVKNIGVWIVEHIVNPFLEGFRKAFGIHSPSTVMAEQGGFIIGGLLKGLIDNIDSVWSWVGELPGKLTGFFDNLPSDFLDIGGNIITGLWNGIQSTWNNLKSGLQDIGSGIVSTFKNIFDIHSPSRVMFELGNYTMQGFQNGLESLYNPIQSSMKQFGSDLRIAPAPNLEEMYGSYRQTVTYAPEYGSKPYGGGSGLLGMSETQVYNLFYNAMKTAIHNEQSGFEDRPIQLKVDLDGREIFNTVYDINQKNTHAGRSFVTEDYRGYHEPAPWITGRNLV